jgi:hypothetical protein
MFDSSGYRPFLTSSPSPITRVAKSTARPMKAGSNNTPSDCCGAALALDGSDVSP